MKTKILKHISLSVLLIFAFSSISFGMTGKEVMKKQKKLHKVDSEYGEEIMLLVDVKSKNKEKRTVKRYSKDMGNDLKRYLLVFLKPSDIRGTSLLTHENKDQDDQWLYMPSVRKMQRIAQGSKKSYFMGTDFTYEDMEPEDIENFTYKIIKSEDLKRKKKKKNCFVIEAIPANKKKKRSSGYSKRILWIEKKNLTTLKIQFFDRRSRLIKTQKLYDLKNITGTVYRPNKSIMNNHKKKHKTLTLATKRKLNGKIENSTFNERFILTGRHLN
ncbi:MAG: outer membrane lipoprotein-sorting protein [Desulfobacterales bacterium]|nr:outer membrane lipoprotein-sorting protein [Desulfobacterales bacterium]